MVRKLQISDFVLLCLLVLPLSSAHAAQVTTASARCLFGRCEVRCPEGSTAQSSSTLFSARCWCQFALSASTGSIEVEQENEIVFAGYVDLLSSFDSAEARKTLEAASQMMDAARKGEGAAYLEAAARHEESLQALSDGELEQIYKYLKVPRPEPGSAD